jgi:hypothetical protein
VSDTTELTAADNRPKPWIELIAAQAADAEFSPPAPRSRVTDLESSLYIALPEQLAQLLSEADGVTADYGAGLVWRADVIRHKNQEFRNTASFRSLYMPFDHLLFFGDDGGGDQFAFPVDADGVIRRCDIFRWDHETDGRAWYASGLRQYVRYRLAKAPREA